MYTLCKFLLSILLVYLPIYANKQDEFIEWKNIDKSNGYLIRIEDRGTGKLIIEKEVNENIYYIDKLPKGNYKVKVAALNRQKKPIIWSMSKPLNVIISKTPIVKSKPIEIDISDNKSKNTIEVEGDNFLESTKIKVASKDSELPVSDYNLTDNKKVKFSVDATDAEPGNYSLYLENPNNKKKAVENFLVLKQKEKKQDTISQEKKEDTAPIKKEPANEEVTIKKDDTPKQTIENKKNEPIIETKKVAGENNAIKSIPLTPSWKSAMLLKMNSNREKQKINNIQEIKNPASEKNKLKNILNSKAKISPDDEPQFSLPEDYAKLSYKELSIIIKNLMHSCQYSDLPNILIYKCYPDHTLLNIGTKENLDLFHFIGYESKNYNQRIEAYKYFIRNCNPSMKALEENITEKLSQNNYSDPEEKKWMILTLEKFKSCK